MNKHCIYNLFAVKTIVLETGAYSYIWTDKCERLLPPHYKKRCLEYMLKEPQPVHWIPHAEKYTVDKYGTRYILFILYYTVNCCYTNYMCSAIHVFVGSVTQCLLHCNTSKYSWYLYLEISQYFKIQLNMLTLLSQSACRSLKKERGSLSLLCIHAFFLPVTCRYPNQNHPIEVKYPVQCNQGLWAGEGIVQCWMRYVRGTSAWHLHVTR